MDNDFNLAADEVELIDKVSKAFHTKGKKVVIILNIGGVIETALMERQSRCYFIGMAARAGRRTFRSRCTFRQGKSFR